MSAWTVVFLAVAALLAGLLVWRATDVVRDDRAWSRLLAMDQGAVEAFDPAMIAGLPEPAQRYFSFAIAPGTPLRRTVELEMTGELGLGDLSDPKYQPMFARQVLAPPHGLVWKLKAGMISGSDGATPETSWTRFWLLHLIPVVRVSGTGDHHVSAFGRVVSEAAFWVPAALLPSETVKWSPVGPDTARVTTTFGDMTEAVDLTVGPDGEPLSVLMQRWSNANPDKEFRRQPFGGTLSEYREFDGFRIPTRVDGGNHIGTADYFPFFKAEVTSATFR